MSIVVIGISMTGFAQQQFQFTQFLHNPYIVNNAFAGVYDQLDISSGYRHQWVGIETAPRTYYVSVNAPLGGKNGMMYNPSMRISRHGNGNTMRPSKISTGKLKHGIGGFMMYDKFGAFTVSTAMASYAVHVPATRDYNVSFSLSAGYSNHVIDDSKVDFLDLGDPTYAMILSNGGKQGYIDLTASALLYSKDLFVGYTGAQLLKDHAKLNSNGGSFDLLMHHTIIAGYNFKLNESMRLTTAMLTKYVHPAPVSFEITGRLIYNNWIWGAVGYRHGDAVSATFGLYLNSLIKLGYSYDFSVTRLQGYNSGTHELVIGVTLK